uniref:Uncharacterized protein n=1 Tax=Salix viminalis TaxID=40686 RepID=A0A6N2KUJ2_SALVM
MSFCRVHRHTFPHTRIENVPIPLSERRFYPSPTHFLFLQNLSLSLEKEKLRKWENNKFSTQKKRVLWRVKGV